MDAKLAASVRREFQTGLSAILPQFEPTHFDHPAFADHGVETGDGGWRVFRWQTGANVWFFLVLGLDSRNRFWFDLLWNTSDHYSVGYGGHFGDDPTIHATNRCQFMERNMTKFWKVGSNPAYVPEVVVPAALVEMKAFAEPIMEKVLERHGTKVE
jgi:hypothetical protein